MPASSPATVIIGCPTCGTRYQLPRDTVGAGRLVKCATCATSWTAAPLAPEPVDERDGDRMFDAAAEERLDAEFVALDQSAAMRADPGPTADERATLEEIKRAIAPRPKPAKAPDPAIANRQQKAFSRRQANMQRQLPTGRLRNSARVAGVSALVVLIAGGLLGRQGIVQQVPDLAAVYAAIGLPVNVVGLQFLDVRTLEMLTDGAPVLNVSGRIASIAENEVAVPPVVITLLNGNGAAVYEWSVTPKARELEPGEAVDFETRLTQPPQGATKVRLSFASSRAQPATAAAPTPTEGKGH